MSLTLDHYHTHERRYLRLCDMSPIVIRFPIHAIK